MRRIASFLLLSAFAGTVTFAADPPLRAGFAFPKADDKPKESPKPADKPKESIPATPLVPKADDTKKRTPVVRKELTRPEQLKQIQDGYKAQCQNWVDAYQRAEEKERKAELMKFMPTPVSPCMGMARLVLANPKDEVAVDALLGLLRYQGVKPVKAMLAAIPPRKKGEPTETLDLLAALQEHHIHNAKLANVGYSVDSNDPAGVAFLTALFEKSSSPDVRGMVGLQLGSKFEEQAEKPDLPAAERDALLKMAEAVFVQLLADGEVLKVKYGRDRTLGEAITGHVMAVRTLSVGKVLPGIGGESLDGKKVAFADYKGKVLLIDAWATWCGPCRAMIPHMRDMVAAAKDKPFAIVSISADEEKKTVEEFLAKEKMPWNHWWDTDNGPTCKALNVHFYPTLYLVDPKGVIRYKNVHDAKKLKELVAKLVKEAEGNADASGGR